MRSVRVLFFAAARDAAGCEAAELRWEGGEVLAAGEFWKKLAGQFPRLAPFQATVRLARNLEYLAGDETITSGDEVALIPPVSGG